MKHVSFTDLCDLSNENGLLGVRSDVLRQGLRDRRGCLLGQEVPGLANDNLGQGSVDELRVGGVIEGGPRAVVSADERQDGHLQRLRAVWAAKGRRRAAR